MKDIKLIVPHTEAMRPIVPEVLEKVLGLTPDYRFMESTDSYHYLLEELWHEREDVVIIEHDVLPWPGAIEEIYNCPAMWCSCSYKLTLTQNGGRTGYGITHSFGCVKFSKELMERMPDAWQGLDSRNWRHLDAQFCIKGIQAGQMPHTHRPSVIHLHEQTRH